MSEYHPTEIERLGYSPRTEAMERAIKWARKAEGKDSEYSNPSYGTSKVQTYAQLSLAWSAIAQELVDP